MSGGSRRRPWDLYWLWEAGGCTIQIASAATQPHTTQMPFAPFVIVTSTTEIIRGISRVRVNEAYTHALTAAGLVPLVLPPIDSSLATASLRDVAGLVLTGGEDIDPRLFGGLRAAAAEDPTQHPDYEIVIFAQPECVGALWAAASRAASRKRGFPSPCRQMR